MNRLFVFAYCKNERTATPEKLAAPRFEPTLLGPRHTWICGVEPDGRVPSVWDRDCVLERRPVQLSRHQAGPVPLYNGFTGHVRAQLLHGNHSERVSVQVKRMVGVVSETCRKMGAVRLEAFLVE